MILRRKPMMPTPEQALPGRTVAMDVPERHTVLNTPLTAPFPVAMEQVLFGMGCFWGAEKVFWQRDGVYSTAVGYGAGYTPNPGYEEVCSGMTGHNELVLVVYDPAIASFAQLLALFWESHDPTMGMRQGNDVGTQYRSGIYVFNEVQEALAKRSQAIYDAAVREQGTQVSTTEILRDVPFYYAEAYHQQYLDKNASGYCPNHTYAATGLPQFPLEKLLGNL